MTTVNAQQFTYELLGAKFCRCFVARPNLRVLAEFVSGYNMPATERLVSLGNLQGLSPLDVNFFLYSQLMRSE